MNVFIFKMVGGDASNHLSTQSSMNNFTVSIYRGATGSNKTLQFENIETVWNRMIDPNNHTLIDWTNKLLNAKASADFKRIKETESPAFIVGKFPERKNNTYEEYAPLLGFDVDGVGFEAIVEQYIQHLRTCPYVRAAYPSPSRTGLRIFVECTSTPDTHKSYYEAVSAYLSSFLDIPTDKDIRRELSAQGMNKAAIDAEIKTREHLDSSTSNLARLWFYAHVPPDLFYHNPHSHIFAIEATPDPVLKPIKRPPSTQLQTLTDAYKIDLCISKVDRQNLPGGRNNYVFAAACEMARFGVDNELALSTLLQYAEPDFDQEEIKKTVESAFKSKSREYSDQQILRYASKINPGSMPEVTMATEPTASLQVEAEQVTDNEEEDNQGERESVERSKFMRIKKYISNRYEFRRNLVSLDIEARSKKKNASWSPLNENDLFCELMEAGFTGVEGPVIALVKSSFVRDYDPFLEYFQSLPKWTPQEPDYIKLLASYVEAVDKVWFETQFKKMLVRMVACAIGRIPFNKHCFVLKSGQNDGKSSFIRFLCPPQLSDYMTDFIDMESKDGRIALCQNFIINLDELSVFSKSDVKRAKALFTLEKIKERLPYDRKASTIKRRASFIASTNEDEFLVDETGNVRWLVFEIKGIRHDNGGSKGYNANIQIDQVYSQAFSLLLDGFIMHLSKDEIAKSERNNQNYQVVTVEQELIMKYFIPASKDEEGSEFMTAGSIMEDLKEKVKTPLYRSPVGRALTALGFEKTQRHDRRTNFQVKGYYVRRLSSIVESV